MQCRPDVNTLMALIANNDYRLPYITLNICVNRTFCITNTKNSKPIITTNYKLVKNVILCGYGFVLHLICLSHE